MRKLFLAAILFSLPCYAFAGAIKGPGAANCGRWVESRENNTWRTEMAWILGFISSYNHFVDEGPNPDGIFGDTDAPALAIWMDKYCRENPLDGIYSGTLKVIDELKLRNSDQS